MTCLMDASTLNGNLNDITFRCDESNMLMVCVGSEILSLMMSSGENKGLKSTEPRLFHCLISSTGIGRPVKETANQDGLFQSHDKCMVIS